MKVGHNTESGPCAGQIVTAIGGKVASGRDRGGDGGAVRVCVG